MLDAKSNCLPFAANHKLDRKYSDDDSILYNILYAEAIGCLMYLSVHQT